MNPRYKKGYAIKAVNGSGVTVYYCVFLTQPPAMLENSYSLACVYHSRKAMLAKIEELKTAYKGLRDWKIENRMIFLGLS